jgi:hypothetical protein
VICAFFIFCSVIVNNPEVTLYPGAVSRIDNMLAAHNYMDGQYFSALHVGDYLNYKQDGWKRYQVTEILTYEAGTNDAGTLAYIHSQDLVLITCIPKGDNPTWGRLLVIAKESP